MQTIPSHPTATEAVGVARETILGTMINLLESNNTDLANAITALDGVMVRMTGPRPPAAVADDAPDTADIGSSVFSQIDALLKTQQKLLSQLGDISVVASNVA